MSWKSDSGRSEARERLLEECYLLHLDMPNHGQVPALAIDMAAYLTRLKLFFKVTQALVNTQGTNIWAQRRSGGGLDAGVQRVGHLIFGQEPRHVFFQRGSFLLSEQMNNRKQISTDGGSWSLLISALAKPWGAAMVEQLQCSVTVVGFDVARYIIVVVALATAISLLAQQSSSISSMLRTGLSQ